MPLVPTAGTKVFIGGVIADKDADFVTADFSAVSWVEIGGTTDIGTIGDKSTLITSDRIGVDRVKKGKGTKNAGTWTIVCGLDYADTGQIAAIAAVQTKSNYAFKVQFDDAPSGGTPSTRTFIALVTSAEDGYAGANNEMKLTIGIEINSNVVRVDAASA